MSNLSILNSKVSQKGLSKIARKKERLKKQLWPTVDDAQLWHRKRSDGWLTIPRAMPLILRIMDMLSDKGKPVSSTYFDLWCRTYDDSFVIVSNPNDMSYSSGFTGERAQSTWTTRMRILEKLGFIDIKEGTIPTNYVLIYNPYKVIMRHRNAGHLQEAPFAILTQRMIEIGADDLEDIPEGNKA